MPTFIRALAATAILSLSTACSEVPNLPLSVGLNPWIGNDPLVLASEQRLFDRARIKVVELPSNSESQRNLRNGLLDATTLTLDEALRIADQGVPISIVAVLNYSSGADAVLATTDIQSPADLKNKRIAVEDGAIGGMILGELLKAGKLVAQDVSLLRVEASQHEGAIEAGWVDAVVTFEPMRSRLLAQGYHVIYDSTDMQAPIIDVLVVRRSVLETRPDDVIALLQAWQRGVTELQSDPGAAAAILAQGAQLTTEQYLATLRGLEFVSLGDSARMLGGSPADLSGRSAWLVENLKDLKLIRKDPDWHALIGASMASRASAASEGPK